MLTGQEIPGAETPPAESFSELVEVAIVNVEVFVTDKAGEPITGLTKDDFELFEDGRPVAITNFYAAEPRGRMPVAPTPPPETPAVPGQPPPNGPGPLEEQRLNLVVWIDNYNIHPHNRNRVFERLREFLYQRVAPGDRVMLVAYDRSARIVHPFTHDAGAIVAALEELESAAAHGGRLDDERLDLLETVEETDETTVSTAISRIRQHAQSLSNDLRFTVGALRDFIGPLAGLPGRKAILHVSDGFPMVPGEDLFYSLQQKLDNVSLLSEIRAMDASRSFEELAASANASRVTFYTVDAGGLRVYGADWIERRGSGWETLSPAIDSMHVANLQSPIRFMAETTGGIAIVNTNDVGPGLDRIGRDFRTYYSLGFAPAHGADGRYHRIEVKVRREEATLRYRQGYRNKSIETLMVEGTSSTLLFGVEQNPAEVALDVGAQSRRDDGLYLVTLLVRIPLGKVVTVLGGDSYRGRLRLFLTAMDEDGGTSPVEQAPIPIEIPRPHLDAALRQSLTYETQLLMRPGHHRVAVGLRDELGGTSSFSSRRVTVGSG